MTQDEARRAALDELLHVSERELHWLLISDSKLFGTAPAAQWMRPLDAEPDLAEAIDAFCARFSRLQDTLGDKLLVLALKAIREPTGGGSWTTSRGPSVLDWCRQKGSSSRRGTCATGSRMTLRASPPCWRPCSIKRMHWSLSWRTPGAAWRTSCGLDPADTASYCFRRDHSTNSGS